MKKCPNCQREFPDAMRFCQTDGTPLADAVEELVAEDPLKTTVVRQEELASMMPPDDPFKTMVASNLEEKDDEDDVLQLPQPDFDPLATMVVPPIQATGNSSLEDLVPTPPVAAPDEPLPPMPSVPIDAPIAPPVFSEPVIEPPSFSQDQGAASDDDIPATVMQSPFEAFIAPPDPPSPSFGGTSDPASVPPPSFDRPSEPPPVAPPSFDPPSEPVAAPSEPAPFQPPPMGVPQSPFSAPQTPFAPESQPMQAAAWNPPPAPVQAWQQQPVGADTPFQPPAEGVAGQSKMLAIISLVAGILGFLMSFGAIVPLISLICMPVSFLANVAAIIMGFMARGRAKNDPENYGGAGLGLGGIILGALGIIVVVGLFIIAFAAAFFMQMR